MTTTTTTTTRNTTTTRAAALLGGALLALLAGCQSHDRRADNDAFPAEDAPRSVRQFADVQAAAGARTDGTLRAYHFDAAELNSLGQEKLDQMLRDDDACSPLAVHLDLPADRGYDARRDAVRVYLKDRGLLDAQVRIDPGPNTANLSPAAPAMRAKKALDGGGGGGVNPEPTGSPSAGGMAGLGGK